MTYKVVLLDIEGTVCPIAFVKDVLFPYFSAKVPELVQSKDSKIQELLEQFNSPDVVAHIQHLVHEDIKDPILKALQGHVWAQGYENGEIKAPVYADSIEFIKRSKNVYIYSSGSVKAQKLLFGHVEDVGGNGNAIDLQPYIRGYFDITTSGKKTEAGSYSRIVKDIGVEAKDVLFVSDNTQELEAGKECGVQVCLALRPGNAHIQDVSKYQCVKDFTQM